jgi:tetratricopeptide (TPR) repeat protein
MIRLTILTISVFASSFISVSFCQNNHNSVHANSIVNGNSVVRIWEEKVIIPTYLTGDPDPNPMFYFGRAYQGAEGRVYPYPIYDKLTGIKKDKEYNMVYLENEFIKIGILPEIGGRIFSALDKTNNYNFIYTQHVVKPALIGMLGAWISGGIEWNIPHHHRATSFLPVQYRLENNSDSSKTVWVGELELRHRTRWAVGYTIRPGRSYIDITVRLFNTSPYVQTMLCFANTAVHANENYQVIFPPSTQYVTFHSKREFTTWPIATTVYNGADFTKGVDVSWYKNHYSSNSLFAWNYLEDFVGGYDHGKDAGVVCYADHNTVPGKKFWTWGNSPYGRMWDKTLTDNDGPYLELMVGSYSDNQPDYSWLQPFEIKDIRQIWYPVRNIGGMKNANEDAAINLDFDQKGNAIIGIYSTQILSGTSVFLMEGEKVLLKANPDIRPDKPFSTSVKLPSDSKKENISVSLVRDGKILISYKSPVLKKESMPEAVIPPKSPDKIAGVEELYLTGRRIEQFHNPSLDPDPYWEEALKRDSLDTRVNTAMGINLIKKAQFIDAEKYFRRALIRLTAGYTTPEEGEPYYYLGLSCKAQNKTDEAYANFFKSTWSEAWKSAGYYSLAAIDCQRGHFNQALLHINQSLNSNCENINSLNLKSSILRHLADINNASTINETVFFLDPLNVTALSEKWMISKSEITLRELFRILNLHPSNALETSLFYINSGLWQDAISLLKAYKENPGSANRPVISTRCENAILMLLRYLMILFSRFNMRLLLC